MIIKFCLVFPQICLLHKVVRDAKKVEKHCPSPQSKEENQLTKKEICQIYSDLAFSVRIWLSFGCPRPLLRSWHWKNKIYVWEFTSCVQFRCRWQAILWGNSWLQNASIKSCNLKNCTASWRAPHIHSWIWWLKRLYNLHIALQIVLKMTISIASCERSFSELKLILSYLRVSMRPNRLCDLALMSIARDETGKTNFDEIIDEFSSIKAGKVLF